MTPWAIEADGISKRYGSVTALDGVSLTVPAGSVLGLLGHNGAGKSTLVNVLTTLVRPSAGRARIAGFDVVTQAHRVRRLIGLTGQSVALDERISGRDNLVLVARLLGAGRREAGSRAEELLDLLDLSAAARRPVRTYSGGMRRRLDLAASLVGSPDVLFLDEPTTGLDPAIRLGTWRILERLVRDGTTVLLTTQYLEEADRLAEHIVVLTDGRVVVSGTPSQLKSLVRGRVAVLRFVSPADAATAAAALRGSGMHPAHDDAARTVTVPLRTSGDLVGAVRALDAAGVEAGEVTLDEPGLDEVFLAFACGTDPGGDPVTEPRDPAPGRDLARNGVPS